IEEVCRDNIAGKRRTRARRRIVGIGIVDPDSCRLCAEIPIEHSRRRCGNSLNSPVGLAGSLIISEKPEFILTVDQLRNDYRSAIGCSRLLPVSANCDRFGSWWWTAACRQPTTQAAGNYVRLMAALLHAYCRSHRQAN